MVVTLVLIMVVYIWGMVVVYVVYEVAVAGTPITVTRLVVNVEVAMVDCVAMVSISIVVVAAALRVVVTPSSTVVVSVS